MTSPTDLRDDFDADFERLRHAQDPDEQRRALRSVLETLYALRAYREGDNKIDKATYHNRADASREGQVTEGVILIRGELLHRAVKRHAPEEKLLYPSETTYPGNWTFPGSNLVWLHPAEMVDPLRQKILNDGRYPFYVAHVAGQPVLGTLQIARDFLVNDPVLGPL